MNFKRMIASALSVSLVLGAAGIAEIQPKIHISFLSASAEDDEVFCLNYGECGENATWHLNSDGTLYIQGEGSIDNGAYSSSLKSESNSIKNVIIKNGITSIGDYVFSDCTNLESITIPDSVTSIGEQAFYCCSSLKSIIIPDSVESIGGYAFFYCKNLESITVPNTVESIGIHAFYKTPWLEFKQKEEPLVIINTTLIDGSTCSGDVVIPDHITSIDGAFEGATELKSITIPDSVTSIYGAFSGCESLESVTIPNSVTSIEFAFSGCTSLKSVTIPDSVTDIGYKAFAFCRGLETVVISDSVDFIDNWAFFECSKLKSITILNPECEIADSKETICNTGMEGFSNDFVIKGYNGSTAEAYANKYGYKFESLGDALTVVTTSATTKVTTTTSTATTTTAKPVNPTVKHGDANCDGKVSVADAVAILQFIGNRDKYGLTADGQANADVDGVAGITGKDALVIQQVDAGLYKAEDLPLKA